MRIRRLKINDFRGIGKLELEFGERINILVGDNGAGKSRILDSIAILLSWLFGRIRSKRGPGRYPKELDITNGKKWTSITIAIVFRGQEIEWTVGKSRRGIFKEAITNLQALNSLVDQIHLKLETDTEMDMPLGVYYTVNRAVLDVPLRIRHKHSFDQLTAYDQALTGGRNDFSLFFEWFRRREDLENETRLEQFNYRDPQLEAVRKAIQSFLPGFSDLRVKRSPLRMTLSKEGEELIINQLSDGEKCLLALVCDLARRLAIANPSRNNPLEGDAVVMIDEVDLHLHPSWQRTVVPNLKRTFPFCQFVLATHSPQILSHVEDAESIFLLRCVEGEIVASHPESTYGLDTNYILEVLMGVPERPEETKAALSSLFLLIDEGKLRKARSQLEKLRKKIGTTPELTKAEVLIHRKETLGR